MIDETGKLIVDFVFESVGEFFNGMAPFQQKRKEGVIGADGKILIAAKFDEIGDREFTDGLIPVKMKNRWGYANLTGDVVIDYRFDFASRFQEGRAIVEIGGKHKIIDVKGNVVIEDLMGCFTSGFSCGRRCIEVGGPVPFLEDGQFGYMDIWGKPVIKPIFQKESPYFSENRAYVKLNGAYGAIDPDGRFVVKPQYANLMDFHEGMSFFLVMDGDRQRWGGISAEGEVVFEPKFAADSTFSEGLASIRFDEERYGFCNKVGDVVIEPQFEGVYDFKEGRAVFWKGRKFGVIDQTGKVVVPAIYSHICEFRGSLAPVFRGKKKGYVNRNGEEVWAPSPLPTNRSL